MRAPWTLVAALLLGSALPCLSQAPQELPRDSQLVHLDTPVVLEQGKWTGRVDVRAFGGDESTTYTSLAMHYGLRKDLEGILRGPFASPTTLNLGGESALRHGGSDLEMAAKYRLHTSTTTPMALLAGVSWANTPAQSDVFLTLGLTSSSEIGSRITAYLCPRAVLVNSNTIVGIGLGARAKLTDTAAIVADYTPVVAGHNTRDTTTGDRMRRDVYGVALRLSSRNAAWSFDLGYANGTGSSTGFGLTPALGGIGGFYGAITYSR